MERLYQLVLWTYPVAFRRAYGSAMVRAFRDRCLHAHRERGTGGLLHVCVAELSDLVMTALKERGEELLARLSRRTVMIASSYTIWHFPRRLWVALVATITAFAVSLVASLNLYMLEDNNPLTQAAYSASPALRLSYDAVYVSALGAGIAVCAIMGYSLTRAGGPVTVVVTLLVSLGGFGGLLVRHPPTFLVLVGALAGLVLISSLIGRAITPRLRHSLTERQASVVGACVSTAITLLFNVVVLVPHTLILNPVSHLLYMQGQIGDTHINSLLVAMGIELLTMICCVLSIGLLLLWSRNLPRYDDRDLSSHP